MRINKLPKKLTDLANKLYEMYSLQELERQKFMLREVSYLSKSFRKIELLLAIDLARQWKRTEQQKKYGPD